MNVYMDIYDPRRKYFYVSVRSETRKKKSYRPLLSRFQFTDREKALSVGEALEAAQNPLSGERFVISVGSFSC